MVQYVSSLNWAGKGTTMHLKRQLRRDTQNHSAWQPLLYTERTLFQTTVVLTQFQSRLCGSISYLHRSLEGKPLHSWPEFSCIGTRRLRSSYQQKMVRNLNGFASTWLRNGSPGPPPAAMSSSISLHYSSGWCTASIYMQFFGKELLNVKLRLTITIGKVFSQTGKRSVGKTCFVILESIAKAWAANLSLVWRRVAHSIYCLLSTSCDAFDDGSGKVRQQASSSINATFHNLPISKQRDREEQPKLRPGPLHDLRSTGVRWAVQRSSLFLTISTNAADPFRSLLAKWIQKWQKSEAYRWKKISLHQKVVLLGWGKGTHWFGLVSSWLLYVSIPHTSFNRSPQRLAGVPSNRSIFARFSDVLLIRMAHRLASLKFAISGLINTLANGGVDFLPCFTKVPVMLDILLLNTQELLIFATKNRTLDTQQLLILKQKAMVVAASRLPISNPGALPRVRQLRQPIAVSQTFRFHPWSWFIDTRCLRLGSRHSHSAFYMQDSLQESAMLAEVIHFHRKVH